MKLNPLDPDDLTFVGSLAILAVVGTAAIAKWAVSETIDHLSKKIGIM